MDNGYNNYGDQNQPVVRNMMETEPKKNNSVAVGSLVCGIISIVLCWGCGISILVGLGGLICGIVSLVQNRGSQGMAVAGMITSAVGLVFGILAVVLYIVFQL